MTCKHCGKKIVQGILYGPKPFHVGNGLMHCDIHKGGDRTAEPKTKDDFIKEFLKQNLL